jgi:hypothetical protein
MHSVVYASANPDKSADYSGVAHACATQRFGVGKALSHYQIERVTNLLARQTHAAVTTSRHVSMADALKARCVLAEVRWRWTLKVL